MQVLGVQHISGGLPNKLASYCTSSQTKTSLTQFLPGHRVFPAFTAQIWKYDEDYNMAETLTHTCTHTHGIRHNYMHRYLY